MSRPLPPQHAQARLHLCPSCNALPGLPCVTKSGHLSHNEHKARYNLAASSSMSLPAPTPIVVDSHPVHIPVRSYSSWFRILLWGSLFTAFILLPSVIYLTLSRSHDTTGTQVSSVTALIGTAMLLSSFAISRVKVLINHLGIEVVLRSHRALAILGLLFVLAHIAAVLQHNAQHVSILNPTSAPLRVISAEAATVALILIVSLALTRRSRKPRYEGFRLWHLILAWTIILSATLHVFLLDRLASRSTIKWFLLAYVIAATLLMLYRWLYRPLMAGHRSYVVKEVRAESPTASTLVLRSKRRNGAKYQPGQFAFLKLSHSPFTFEEHPFTVSSDATDPHYKEITIKALGDFTEMVESIRPGRHVYLDGPYGRFTMDSVNHSHGFVFIAGGVGITPMISMLRTLATRHDRRPHLLIVAARSVEELIFREDVVDLCTNLNLRVVEVLDTAPIGWSGEQGRVSLLLLKKYLPHRLVRNRLDFFVCGSPPMVVSVISLLEKLEIPTKRYHSELFDMV